MKNTNSEAVSVEIYRITDLLSHLPNEVSLEEEQLLLLLFSGLFLNLAVVLV